ncbi:MAG TPA: hypothetical protein VFI52_05855 [Gemmatimonadaceae bacterium]|nr:hypothetical protein [Gemmatimonadaceae bacterium]
MSATRRDAPFSPIPLPLLAASIQVHRGELEEQAALHDAWRETVVWFAVVVVLILGLIVVRQRRKPVSMLDQLFKTRRLSDFRRWRQARDAMESPRLARREEERIAEVPAQAAARAAAPPPVQLGPPTLGVVRRFGICLLASTIMSVLAYLGVARSLEDYQFIAVVFGVGALLASALASFICALLVSVLPRQNIAIGIVCGALSAAVPLAMIPPLPGVRPELVLAAGALMGLILGIADWGSRRPIAGAPAVATLP